MNRALVVLSGGQDSTTSLFWTKKYYSEVYAISFDYGQRHAIELSSAVKVADMAGVKTHELIGVKGVLRSASPLTSDNPLEQYESFEQMDKTIGDRVELTFVPMRNALFGVVAANRALHYGCSAIVLGVCEADNANYPDCRQSFLDSMEMMFIQALGKSRVAIHAPLISKTKAESIKLALTLPGCMRALAYSHTSYDGLYPPTGMNHANVLRAEGFRRAGVPDPLVVRAWSEGLMDLPETKNYDEIMEGLALGTPRAKLFAGWIKKFS